MKLKLIADTHGNDFEKIKRNTDCDYIVVLGDFGFTNSNLIKLNEFLKENNKKILFVDGNHENYKKLKRIKEVEMFGGKVGVYAKNIYWLKRGEVYEMNNKKILVFGGAFSIDRFCRIENISWFKEEEYSKKDYENLYNNIIVNNYEVDYVFSHDCPLSIGKQIHKCELKENKTAQLLEGVSKICNFKKWFFGHHHIDIEIGKYVCLWEKDYVLDF